MRRTSGVCLVLFVGAASGLAQRTPEYDFSVVRQTRIDLRDLGYPPLDVIPSDECAIRALAVSPEGLIYGATSGKRSHLFVLNPQHGYVQPLGWLRGVTTVHHALVVSRSGEVYLGGSIGVDNGGEGYAGYGGGHLWRYSPKAGDPRPDQVNLECPVTDLGAVAAGEGIYTLAIDRQRDILYGLTYPTGQFFSYDIPKALVHIHGRVAERRIPGEKFEKDRALGRALVADRNGNVFASGESGFLFHFDRTSGSLHKLAVTAPTVPGREPYNRVDAWTPDNNGNIYGGTSDGYLFRLNPETLALENLGKPLNQYRIRGLVFAADGKLYGVGGDDDEMARLFSYDPAGGVYRMLGMIDVNHRPYYSWQAYVIDSVAIGLDGTIYLGQSERRSKLYLYYPE
jgi:hypothetical protein